MKKTLLLVLSLAFLFCLCLTACSSAAPEERADPDAAESDRVLIKYQNTLYMKYQKVTTDEKYLEDYAAVYQLKEAGETEKELKNLVPKENLEANNLPKGTRLFYEESTRLLYYVDAEECLWACCAVSMMDGKVLGPTGSPVGMEGYMIRYRDRYYFGYGDNPVRKEPKEYCEGIGAEYIGQTSKQTYFSSDLSEDLAAAHLPLGTDIWYLASEDCLLAEVPEWGVIKLTQNK